MNTRGCSWQLNHVSRISGEYHIDYSIQQGGLVEIKIFNVKGEMLKTLVSENKQSGNYSITWDGKSNRGSKLPSGVYFYTLRMGGITSSKKMVLLR